MTNSDLLGFWGEFLMFVFLIITIVISLFVKSFPVFLIVIFLFALFLGKLWFRQRKSLKFGLFFSIVGIMLGFILGKMFNHTVIIVLVFFAGIFISYYVHKKGWISSIEF